MRAPSNNKVRLFYGAIAWPYTPQNPHKGVDILPDPDRNIYAPEAGRVTLEYDTGTNADGNAVHLWADNRHHAFCHMSSFNVVQNQMVNEGQLLGVMGSTGDAYDSQNRRNTPEAAHLHWAVKQDNRFIDPLSLLTGGKGADMLPEGIINDNDDIAELWRLAFFRDPTDEEIKNWQILIGKYWNDASKYLRSTDAFIGTRQQYYDGADSQYEKVTEELFRKKQA